MPLVEQPPPVGSVTVGVHWTHIVTRATQSRPEDNAEDLMLTAAIERLSQVVFQGNTHSATRSTLETSQIGTDWTRLLLNATMAIPPNPIDLFRFQKAAQNVCEVLFGSFDSSSTSSEPALSVDLAGSHVGSNQSIQEEETNDVEVNENESIISEVAETNTSGPQQQDSTGPTTGIQVNSDYTVTVAATSAGQPAQSLTTTTLPPTSSAPSAIAAADYFWNVGSNMTNSASGLSACDIPDSVLDAFPFNNAYYGGITPTHMSFALKPSSSMASGPSQTRTVFAPLENGCAPEALLRNGAESQTINTPEAGKSPASVFRPTPSSPSSPSKVKSTTSQKGKQSKAPAAKVWKKRNRTSSASWAPHKRGEDNPHMVYQTLRAKSKRTASRPANMSSGAHLVVEMLRDKEANGERVQVPQICRIMQYRIGKKGGKDDDILDDFIVRDRRELFHSAARKNLSRSHLMLLDISRSVHIGCCRETIRKEDGEVEYRTWIFLPDSESPYYQQEQEALLWDARTELFYDSDEEETSMNDGDNDGVDH
ncbi:hypothetical protein A4X13_0g4499 [Tilletia indica]|uniref:Uncharacterized protein n=1 Tax=Tilletia indica TaxID=43049 RepID=A0A177TV78_9BASI|nr:hypothetical protein A4X13_0g4499 [Tilletia indica]